MPRSFPIRAKNDPLQGFTFSFSRIVMVGPRTFACTAHWDQDLLKIEVEDAVENDAAVCAVIPVTERFAQIRRRFGDSAPDVQYLRIHHALRDVSVQLFDRIAFDAARGQWSLAASDLLRGTSNPGQGDTIFFDRTAPVLRRKRRGQAAHANNGSTSSSTSTSTTSAQNDGQTRASGNSARLHRASSLERILAGEIAAAEDIAQDSADWYAGAKTAIATPPRTALGRLSRRPPRVDTTRAPGSPLETAVTQDGKLTPFRRSTARPKTSRRIASPTPTQFSDYVVRSPPADGNGVHVIHGDVPETEASSSSAKQGGASGASASAEPPVRRKSKIQQSRRRAARIIQWAVRRYLWLQRNFVTAGRENKAMPIGVYRAPSRARSLYHRHAQISSAHGGHGASLRRRQRVSAGSNAFVATVLAALEARQVEHINKELAAEAKEAEARARARARALTSEGGTSQAQPTRAARGTSERVREELSTYPRELQSLFAELDLDMILEKNRVVNVSESEFGAEHAEVPTEQLSRSRYLRTDVPGDGEPEPSATSESKSSSSSTASTGPRLRVDTTRAPGSPLEAAVTQDGKLTPFRRSTARPKTSRRVAKPSPTEFSDYVAVQVPSSGATREKDTTSGAHVLALNGNQGLAAATSGEDQVEGKTLPSSANQQGRRRDTQQGDGEEVEDREHVHVGRDGTVDVGFEAWRPTDGDRDHHGRDHEREHIHMSAGGDVDISFGGGGGGRRSANGGGDFDFAHHDDDERNPHGSSASYEAM